MCGADYSLKIVQTAPPGSPPRVRSRQPDRHHETVCIGITSACAEQTPGRMSRPCNVRDHLRVCGADDHTPPHPCFGGGITSACAEQTGAIRCRIAIFWDHLRVCGADVRQLFVCSAIQGSPPRVRSRRIDIDGGVDVGRITSACAEQTRSPSRRSCGRRDHLRVCGADYTDRQGVERTTGSPPRVRSRRHAHVGAQGAAGITSACAEQTTTPHRKDSGRRDHLRVCGADVISSNAFRSASWITSACAEQTRRGSLGTAGTVDHLRVCGADWCRGRSGSGRRGSPPRVRSRPRLVVRAIQVIGITSACAEQTGSA